ncbi:MAG: hypothetical protein MI919_03020 [Holophagales bacterium]|nr:hypothetical protein [Holophagales bacterium]
MAWPAQMGATYDWFDPGRAWASYAVLQPFFRDTQIVSIGLDDRPRPGGGGTSECIEDRYTACLVEGRFRLHVDWWIPGGSTPRTAVFKEIAGSENSALFWFFDEGNLELLTKVLDGCALNGHHWIYSAGTTDLEYTLYVVDTFTNASASYRNEPGRAAPAINDTTALPCL